MNSQTVRRAVAFRLRRTLVTLMEAMTAGVPVISFACESGTDEMIENGVNGFIVTNHDTQVVEAARRLVTDSDLWQSLSAAAIQTIAGRFSAQGGAELWAKLLRRAAYRPSRLFYVLRSRLLKEVTTTTIPAVCQSLPPIHAAHFVGS